jgi:GT2 family glycosyltransferase
MAAWARDSKTLDSLKRIMMCEPAPAEILVHVDGGNDQLASRIRELFPEVRVLLSQERLGPGGARNLLLRTASHPFVASFDDDSYPINLDYFAAVESEFENHPEASILVAAVRDIEEPEGPKFTTIRRSAAFVGCGCAYRRSTFLGTSGYVPLRLAYGMEEVDLSMRLHVQGAIILQSPKLKVHHDTDMRHRFVPTVNAAVTSNAALLVFLRYPIILWPLGFLQFLKIVYSLIRDGRSKGILGGVMHIPAHILQYRKFRKTLRPGELMSYIALRRRCAREDVSAR